MTMHDIFISFSTKDREIADLVCWHLSSIGITYWIAHNDIRVGHEFPNEIMLGLQNSRCVLLIFSKSADDSKYCNREIKEAVELGIPIIPYRIENVAPTGNMKFHIGICHWLEAWSIGHKKALEQLNHSLATISKRSLPTKVSDNRFIFKRAELFLRKNIALFTILIAFTSAITVFYFTNNTSSTPDFNFNLEQYHHERLLKLTRHNFFLAKKTTYNSINSLLKFSDPIPNRSIEIEIDTFPEKPVFRSSDPTFNISISPSTDAYIILIVHMSDGNSHVIFPGKQDELSKVPANDRLLVGGSETSFKLTISEPYGVDLYHVIAVDDVTAYFSIVSHFQHSDDFDAPAIKPEEFEQYINTYLSENEKSTTENVSWGEAFLFVETAP